MATLDGSACIITHAAGFEGGGVTCDTATGGYVVVAATSLRWGPLVSVSVGTSRRQFSESVGTVWITVFGERGVTDTMRLKQVSEPLK